MNAPRSSESRRWLQAVGGMLAVACVGYWLGGPNSSDAQPQPMAAEESSGPVVRGYRVPQDLLQSATDRLREAFADERDVRFAVDSRTGQILVIAAADAQPRVERWLTDWLKRGAEAAAKAEPKTASPAASPAETAPPIAAAKVARRALRHVSTAQVESSLRALWGGRLVVARRSPEGQVTLTLPSEESPAVLQLDPQRKVVQIVGVPTVHAAIHRLLDAVDQPIDGVRPALQLIEPDRARDPQFRSTLAVLRAALDSGEAEPGAAENELRLAQNPATPAPADAPAKPAAPPADKPGDAGDGAAEAGDGEADGESGLLGTVQIEIINEYGILVIRGKKRDVERVEQIIRDLEAKSKEAQLQIQVYALAHANNEAVAGLVNQVYAQFLAARQGAVGVYPLVKPNALLLVGQPDSLEGILDLIRKLDRPVSPTAQWRVFPLEHVSAAEASQTINSFYNQRGGGAGVGGGTAQPGVPPGAQTLPGAQGQPFQALGATGGAGAVSGLGARIEVVPDLRSNALIVRGSPRDLADVAALLKKLDVTDSLAQSEVRVFKLTNTLARDLAPVLSAAIRGQTTTGGAAAGGGGQGAFPGGQAQLPGAGGGTQTTRSTSLNFVTVDKDGNRIVASGIPGDVVVNADTNSNSLIVRASKKTMELIAAIIQELDSLPDASAQLKVFTIVHSDATYLAQMLQQLFGQQVTIGRGSGGFLGANTAGNALAQAGLNTGDSSLVPLRFAVDARTNSIIVSGSAGDLKVVEALLIRLDEDDVPTRRISVYRLKNAFAQDVTTAVTQFLTQQRQVVQQNLAFNVAIDPFEQLEREVAIAAEPISNSVIVSATPQFYERIIEIIEQLDFRPPMVMVQVLIAEVRLTDVYEFGVELGLQDSLLFDRGKASLAGANPPSTPGFGFNGGGLPNANSLSQSNLAGSALSTLGVGRANSALGYGGMVLSAASDSVSILIRALQDAGRLQVLSRPQVMAIHNRQARILVGQKVPRITGTTFNTLGNPQNQVNDVDVGLILNIIPQINDDGIVVLNVQAERSRLGSEADGVTIAVDNLGNPIKSPPIDNTSAVTTISARDGQTVVFAGLITSEKVNNTRGVPYLSNLPLIGNLFRYEFDTDRRTELLIVMTPRIVKDDQDYDWLNSVESERMSWCLSDVVNLHGDVGLRGNNNLFCCDRLPVIYPDLDPTGSQYLQPESGPPADDKLFGEGRPTSRRPITGQPGARPAPGASPVYIQPADGATLPPPPGVPAEPSAVRPAGWNSPQAGPYGGPPPSGDSSAPAVPAGAWRPPASLAPRRDAPNAYAPPTAPSYAPPVGPPAAGSPYP